MSPRPLGVMHHFLSGRRTDVMGAAIILGIVLYIAMLISAKAAHAANMPW